MGKDKITYTFPEVLELQIGEVKRAKESLDQRLRWLRVVLKAALDSPEVNMAKASKPLPKKSVVPRRPAKKKY